MEAVHSEVAEATIFAAELLLALPVDGLLRIKVGAVPEAAFDFHDAAELVVGGKLADEIAARIERHFTAAPDQDFGVCLDRLENFDAGGLVDAERFFPHEVLAGIDDVAIDIGVKVVGDGAVNRVDIFAGEEVAVVGTGLPYRGKPGFEPVDRNGIGIAGGDDLRSEIWLRKMAPARTGRGELAAHQAATNHAESDDFLRHIVFSVA